MFFGYARKIRGGGGFSGDGIGGGGMLFWQVLRGWGGGAYTRVGVLFSLRPSLNVGGCCGGGGGVVAGGGQLFFARRRGLGGGGGLYSGGVLY